MSYVALTKYGGGRHAILVTNPKAVAQVGYQSEIRSLPSFN